MTSFTHFYRNSIFARASINLVIFLLIYLAIVRPLRMQGTILVVYPMLNILFEGSAEVLLSQNDWGVRMHFQDIDQRIPVSTPFGPRVFGIPFILLFLTCNWKLLRKFTYYHIIITFVLPLLFSLFFMRWVWAIMPTDIFSYLTKFLGMSFCVFALKELYNEHFRVKEAIGVGGGER
ncbi:MAG: hypothetical protein QF443_04580 [Dehalococcoidia bacterium]|jgi:hypothetical protein|nr:hypothetical protein [Dehalococcoidia bacterium]